MTQHGVSGWKNATTLFQEFKSRAIISQNQIYLWTYLGKSSILSCDAIIQI